VEAAMRDFHPQMRLIDRRMNFLDATEEEVVDLVRSFVNQLAIMSSCLDMPTEQRKTLRSNIASCEAYLSRRHPLG
jgi:hypothetical protein